MKLMLSLAWRNLWRNPRRTLLSASAVGTMVALLIFVQSMQLGSYDNMVDHAASVMHGHSQVQRADYVDEPRVRYVLENAEAIADQIRTIDGVRSATPRAMSSALASKDEATYGAMVVGVDPDYEPLVSWLPGALSDGRYLRANDNSEAVVGDLLAQNLGLTLGDEIVLLGVTPKDGMAAVVAEVVGLFSSGQPALDRAIVHIPLAAFQEAFEMPSAAHSVAVMYNNYTDAESALPDVNRAIEDQLTDSVIGSAEAPGGAPDVALWNRLLPEIEGAIASDKASSGVLYAVLVILATFSIANTFVMMLFERTREFGSLLAMGARPGTLRGTIALETLMLASLGALAGAILGAALAHYIGKVGISLGSEAEDVLAQFQMPKRIYFGVSWPALLATSTLMIVTTQIAAFLATRRVHSMQIVQAIREEM